MSILQKLVTLLSPARRKAVEEATGNDKAAELPASWLVIGLGNPGAKYEGTRHNVGYLALDRLLQRRGTALQPVRGVKAQVSRVEVDGEDVDGSEGVLLVRSTTFMNLSGEAVAPLAAAYGIAADHVIAVHDELDLPAGKVKVKLGGNENGHNGLKSITEKLGTRDYVRVRVGIGRPAHGTGVVEHVLTGLDADRDWEAIADTAADAVDIITAQGVSAAQNEIHRRG